MSSQEAVPVSLIKVTPRLGQEVLGGAIGSAGVGHRADRSRRMRENEAESKPLAVGAYANQRLNLAAQGKAHGRDAKTSNRTWEIRPSGIIGGPSKT